MRADFEKWQADIKAQRTADAARPAENGQTTEPPAQS